jgi:hypothetical protein
MAWHGLLERPLHTAKMYVRWLVMPHRGCGVWLHHSKAVACVCGAQFCGVQHSFVGALRCVLEQGAICTTCHP